MGCVQGKRCGRYKKRCSSSCCHYQPSSISTDATDPFRIHETDSSRGLPLHALSGGFAVVPSAGICLRYASLTQRGHYPDSPDRANQDSFCVKTGFQANPDLHFFGVFDGHGQFGTQCSVFVRDNLADILSGNAHLSEDPVEAYHAAFLAANSAIHDSEIDDSMSGTTAITVLVDGNTLYVANVGDSRAVAGIWNGNRVMAEDLSTDQTPYRKDEYERVKLCGARVLSVDQVEGIVDPDIQSWGDEEDGDGDPPRLWVQNGMYPGTAFTRSVGDSTAESIGVIGDPEVKTVKITPNHLFFVVASDGIFEFLSSQAVVDMVSRFADPQDACLEIASESYKLWLENENRTDDITVIVVQIRNISDSYAAANEGAIQTNNNNASLDPGKLKVERYIVSRSEVNLSKKSSCLELQSCLPDCSVDLSSARAAPSTQSFHLNAINSD
uniref:protein-serine/threonine phosphatase n=1 Tax=Musa acuminata subsp. malaccensis TaxID=214687 RepID=A0A804KVI6_MUSAM|nr:PREDICTED: probable protein phosphatase 2C 35 [Musa acuminata subsp. malaccensis]